MGRLKDLEPGAYAEGLAPGGAAKVLQRKWSGGQNTKLTLEASAGAVRIRLVYRNEELSVAIVKAGHLWFFDGHGLLLRLVSEAYRNRLAHLFDPYPAIHTTRIDPLPHQLTAVYSDLEEASALPSPLPPLHRDSRAAR